jgi:hypothetical protein
MRPIARPLAICLSTILLAACGDDGPRGIRPNDTTASDTSVTPDTAETPDSTDDADPGDAAVTEDVAGNDTAGPEILPNACDDARPCARGACRSGVCIEDPPAAAIGGLDDPATALPSDKPIDLSCADVTWTPPAEPGTATMFGALARFGSGRRTDGLRVDVILAEDFDPTACEGIADPVARKTCFRELGPIIGTATTGRRTLTEDLPASCFHHEECPWAYQCYDPHKIGGKCEEQFGVYEIANLPLDTQLVIRAYPLSETDQERWHDTWMFNVILHSEAATDGRIQYDAQIVSASQWLLTANSVGLDDIPPENGAIGGRLRDCDPSDRESWPIREVRVGLARRAQKIVYFNDLEDDTVPLVSRETTNVHGRYAALDIPSGWNVIAGSIRIGNEVRSVGALPIYVFPDALTIASWPGSNPFWRQKD